MAKSDPVPASPPDDAAASEATAAREKTPVRERRWLRVPASLVVTILLAIVSVWIAPALTRQWEDRQKERELKAEIIDEVTTRTAQIIGKTDAATETGESMRGFQTEWNVFRSRTEAKLLTYFPRDVAKQWADVAELVANWISLAAVRKDESDERTSLVAALGLEGFDDPGECVHGCIVSALQPALRQRVNRFTAVLLRANSDAFSTTRGDLFRDLLPAIHKASRDKLEVKISRRLGYEVSECVVFEKARDGTSYECAVDYSVESVIVDIDKAGNVYPPSPDATG